jgi:hypothetical protein
MTECMLEKQGGKEWIYPAQDRNQWLALVNTVMKLWLLSKAGNS